MTAKSLLHCPACGAGDAIDVLETTDIPLLCNRLFATRSEAMAAPRGDMELVCCSSCSHFYNRRFDAGRIDYTVGGYENSLHASTHFRNYADALARRLIDDYGIRDREVVEIGCGNGEFLSLICSLGCNRGTGYEPGRQNITLPVTDGGEARVVGGFFTSERLGDDVALVLARHVLEHLERPADLLRVIHAALGEPSRAVLYIEVPNVLFTIEEMGIWDLIYEHVSYFTPGSLARLMARAGFATTGAGDAFGGQFLWLDARLADAGGRDPGPSDPSTGDIHRAASAFGTRYRAILAEWTDRLDTYRRAGARIALWGAGSKGVTFLNTLGIGDDVPYIVDLNPRKHGKFVPGTGQQIVAPDTLIAYRPDTVLVMNPLYRNEIAQQLTSMELNPSIVTVC